MHNSEAVVSQELKPLPKHTMLPGWPLQLASLAYRVWCAIKILRNRGHAEGLRILFGKTWIAQPAGRSEPHCRCLNSKNKQQITLNWRFSSGKALNSLFFFVDIHNYYTKRTWQPYCASVHRVITAYSSPGTITQILAQVQLRYHLHKVPDFSSSSLEGVVCGQSSEENIPGPGVLNVLFGKAWITLSVQLAGHNKPHWRRLNTVRK